MTGALLCTTISSPDCSEMARRARLALSMGSDLVELRIDHLLAPDSAQILESLSDVFPRAVVTVRPASEGGRFVGSERRRLDLLRELASSAPAFVDVELAAAEREPRSIDSLAPKKIVSWHDFKGTPSISKLAAKARAAVRHGHLAKVVTTANDSGDVDRILSLYAQVDSGRLIAFCMGALGVRSRTEAIKLGSPLTYCSLTSEPVTPGQIPLAEMRSLLRSYGH